VASRGRLRLTHGRPAHSAGTPFTATLAILSSPKPTTVSFYLERRRPTGEQWSKLDLERGYDGEVALKGRKLYRHHHQARAQEFGRVNDTTDDQNRTVRDVLPAGNRFTFEIDFENLADVELGALLWTLEMDGRGFHRLGFAKPLGFGSVRVSVRRLEAISATARYASLADSGVRAVEPDRWRSWVRQFKTALASAHGAVDFEELGNVVDLRALLGEPGELSIHYPRTDEQPSAEGKNFEWFVENKREGHGLPPPTQDAGLPLLSKQSGRR
jgi:CRISPR-associated protein (TIGR03986 family)